MLMTAWGLAVLLSLPQTYVFHVEKHPKYPWYEQCVTFGSFSSRLYEFLYFFMGMIFLYILPLLVIMVTYGGIIKHLHQKSASKKKSKHIEIPQWPNDLDEEGKRASPLVRGKLRHTSNRILFFLMCIHQIEET